MVQWEQRGDPFKDHQCWSPSLGFIKGPFVGNIPMSSGDLLKQHLNSLPVATGCAGLDAVSILVCISSLVVCAHFVTPAIIFNVLLQLQVLEYLST